MCSRGGERSKLAAWAKRADSSVGAVTCGFEALLDSPQITSHERKVTKGYNLFLFSVANTRQCTPLPTVFELQRSCRHWVYFPSLKSLFPGSPHGKRGAANELDHGQLLHPLIMPVTAILSLPSFLGLISQGKLCVLSPQQAYPYTALIHTAHPLISCLMRKRIAWLKDSVYIVALG